MRNLKINYLIKLLVFVMIYFVNIKCTRDLSADAPLSKNSNLAEVFTDSPIGMGTDFYFPYGGSKATAWTVDQTESYKGNASMRFDVPNDDDSAGSYAGGIFRVDGAGRDLTGYDSLTFWAKASQGVSISQFGFGEDFNTYSGNKYIATIVNTSVGTSWKKYIIPIPDASKLVNEKGMFRYAAGTQGTNGRGYTFWIDELKFEKLGTIKVIEAKILNGQNLIVDGFLNSTQIINQISVISNLANGSNVTVNAAPSYFNFFRSDSNLPIENQLLSDFSINNGGQIYTNVVGLTGTSTITAQLNNSLTLGSLKINAAGTFVNAPIPTLNPANVISIYSDSYSTLLGFNPGSFAGGATGSISETVNNGNNHLNYKSIDFIGMGWTGTVNASSKTTMHIDVKLISAAGSNLKVELKDFGPDGIDNNYLTGGDTSGGNNISSQLIKDQWVGLNIPLNQFTLSTGGGGAGNPNRNNLGFIVLVSSTGASFLVDNIYFY